MRFSELMQSIQADSGIASVAIPADWRQGRAVFGGLQAAIGLAAMRTLVADLPLRSLQVTFLAPMAGDLLTARAQILRQGKSASHVEARLVEGDQVLAIMVGVFGASRFSTVELIPQQPAVDCEQAIQFTYIEGITPTFMQHFQVKWLRGGLSFSGIKLPEAVLELSLLDEGVSTEANVLAIADYIPPIALAYLTKLAPGSSMTWMIEFLTDELRGMPLQGWRVDAQMIAARDGYTHQTLMLWGPGGVPVALSRQTMVIFE